MYTEQRILQRLGLENQEELLGFLDLSNRLDKIKYFYPEFQFSTNNLIEISWENDGYFKLIGSDNKKTKGTTSFRRGWETILRSTSKSSESEDLGKLNKTPEGFPKGNIPKGNSEDWYFHRGHIFARRFHKYVVGYKILNAQHQDTQEKWSKISIDSQAKNLFTQFSRANKAQAEIEEETHQLLQSEESVYYEVKAVFKDPADKYPIGTEIFYVSLSSHDEFAHYFIPNVDFGFNLENSQTDYADFYKNGYSEENHRKFFADSDRKDKNWQISENESCTVESNGGNFSIRKLSKIAVDSLIENLKKNNKITTCSKHVQDGERWTFLDQALTHFTSTGTLRLQGKDSSMFEKAKQYLLDYLSKED